MFPKAFSKVPTPRADLVNLLYKGWNVKLDRIIFVNGARTSFESRDRIETHDDGMVLNIKATLGEMPLCQHGASSPGFRPGSRYT